MLREGEEKEEEERERAKLPEDGHYLFMITMRWSSKCFSARCTLRNRKSIE